jgi:hypothetical protein
VPGHPRLATGKFGPANASGASSPDVTRIAAIRATKSPMTRFVRSISSFSRIGPFGTVADIVLMHSSVRDNESTTAQIGSIDGGADGELGALPAG